MWQSQPSNQLFTIALSGPGQTGPEALTHEERHEYDALLYVERRCDWLAGRLAAKRAIAQRFGVTRLASVQLESRPGQAPAALTEDAGTWYPLPATISVAHTRGWGLAAIADRQFRIGVDIDHRDAVDGSHARYFLTSSESRALDANDAALLWVQKEAAWKAFGLEASDAFMDLELELGDDLIARAAVVRGKRVAVDAAVWMPAHGLVAAAVWTAKEAA